MYINHLKTPYPKNKIVKNKKPAGKKPDNSKIQGDTVSIGQQGNNPINLHILHINDFHGAIEPFHSPFVSEDSKVGGIANMKSVIDTERARDFDGTMLLNAGDIAEGSMVSYVSKGRVIGDAFNDFKFDAITPGNHDFSWGKDGFNYMVQDIETPIVGANIVNTATGKVMEGLEPYTIIEKKGVKIGIIGVDTPGAGENLEPELLKGIEFKEGKETVEKYIPEVRKKGADIIVINSHLGLKEDEKLAEEVKGIDVIVGGHSHSQLEEGKKVGNTVIVQAGTMGEYLGKLDLDIDPETKKILKYNAKLIPIIAKDVRPDPFVKATIAPYLEEARKFGEEVMGKATEVIHFEHKTPGKVNQILADAIVKEAGTEIGLCSARVVRGDIPEGTVTKKDLFNAIPFTEENIIVLDIKGKYIREYIEARLEDKSRGIAIPAGSLKYSYDPSRPDGQKVTSVTAGGKELDPERSYSIAVNDSIPVNKAFSTAESKKKIGPYQKAFFEYFKEHQVWDDKTDDRITVVNSNL